MCQVGAMFLRSESDEEAMTALLCQRVTKIAADSTNSPWRPQFSQVVAAGEREPFSSIRRSRRRSPAA